MSSSNCPFLPDSLVVAYLRDSGGDDQDLSVPQQESEIRAWCQQHNLVLAKIYRDEARSGSTTIGRSGFQQMVDYFNTPRRPERGIIVWKYSRFAREIDDAQHYKSALRRAGYIIHSLQDNIPDGLDGRLFEAAVDWMNARFLKDLSEDVKRGLHHNITQHGAVGGTPPRGFRRGADIYLGQRRDGRPHIVHRWEPDPELAPLVQQAFQMRARGASYAEINQAQPRPLYTSVSGWYHFFTNKIYIGTLIYGERVIENYCAPLVDQQTFDRVQEIMKMATEQLKLNENHPRRKNSSYLLSGIVRCGVCGAPLSGETVYSRKKDHTNRYYACSAKKKKIGESCPSLNIPQIALENAVVMEVVKYILDMSNLTRVRQQIETDLQQQAAERQQKQHELLEQQKHLVAQLNNLAEAVANNGANRILMQKIAEKETELNAVKAQLHDLESQERLPDDDQLQITVERLTAALTSNDQNQIRSALHKFISHINVKRTENKITGIIFYHLPDETSEFMSIQRSHRWDSDP